MTTNRRILLTVWATIGTPFAFFAFIWSAYRIAQLSNAMPAYQENLVLLFWVPATLLALSGALALYHAMTVRFLAKASVVLAYCFVYFWALAWGGLLIACHFGDCI